MNGKTHILFGLAAGLIFVKLFPQAFFSLHSKFIFGLLLVLGSVFPDIDYKIKILKHRGFTHSIYIAAILLAAAYFSPAAPYVFLGFGIGYASHLIGDMITLEGVPIAHPLKYRIRGPFKTGGFFELLITSVLALLILFFI